MSRLEKIDAYFQERNYYPHIPYVPVGELIVSECSISGLLIRDGCALVEKESGGKNLFGCDWGLQWITNPPFCQVQRNRATCGKASGKHQ